MVLLFLRWSMGQERQFSCSVLHSIPPAFQHLHEGTVRSHTYIAILGLPRNTAEVLSCPDAWRLLQWRLLDETKPVKIEYQASQSYYLQCSSNSLKVVTKIALPSFSRHPVVALPGAEI